MHKLYELKEKLMRELEDYADNGKFSKEDVEAIKYTASAIDHICNIVDGEEGEYNEAMDGRYADGMGGSYARRGRSSYAGRNRRGTNQYGAYGSYARGYSRASEDLAEQLRNVMADAPNDKIRMEIERLANKVEQM